MRPRVALLPWGDAIEDFLDPLGLDLAGLREEMSGGWLFGYVDALGQAGVEATVVCCSRDEREVRRWRHRPTGAELLVLPVPRAALRLRAGLADPYAWSAAAAARRPGRLGALRAQPAHQLAPYGATPLRLLGREARRGGWRALLVQEYEYQRFDVAVALGRALGIPVVATYQGGAATRTGLERRVRPRTVPRAAGLIVASAAEAQRVRETYGVAAERIAELPNPLHLERWGGAGDPGVRAELGLPADAVVVAWHGRVELHRKGLDVLVDAWAALRARPDLPVRRLLLVGTGAQDAALRGLLDERGLDDVVWVDRYVLDKARVADLLRAADLYAFPSRHEGFAVAPLEAMASGLAVVAAAAPGVAELLPDGEASGGLVVAPGEAPAFADALAGLLSDPARRRRLGEAARRRAEAAFGLEAVGARLREVLLGPS